MNLHAIVSSAISAVNPPVNCILKMSTGFTVGADGTQIPTYQEFDNVLVQVQALSYTDLMKLGALNVQGTRRKAYLNGNWEGLNRQQGKGGDLIIMPSLPTFPGPTTWLIAMVLEHFEGWTSVALTLQNGG